MEETIAIPLPQAGVDTVVRRIISIATHQTSLEEQKRKLSDLIDRVEQKLIQLRNRLLAVASTVPDADVQDLVRQMRDDEQLIISLCIHRCDHEDPQLSIEHDLTNNDYSLNLQESLAAARHFGISSQRVFFLHRLQREICRELNRRGIETSQN